MSSVEDALAVLAEHLPPDAIVIGTIGIAGAVIGSAVSVIWTEFFNLRTRRRDRKERYAAGANSMYHKLHGIYSHARQVKRHLDEGVRAAALSGLDHTFLSTKPMRDHQKDVDFTVEELWVMTRTGGSDLVNRLSMMDQMHNTLSSALRHYEQDRRPVMLALPPQSMTGLVGTLLLDPLVMQRLAPFMAELDDSLVQMNEIATDLSPRSFEGLRALVLARDQPLGKKFGISVTTPDGEQVEIKATDAPKRTRWWTSTIGRLRTPVVPKALHGRVASDRTQ